MHDSVYAVILNWNNFEDTCEAVESLRASDRPFSRILLVDNGSEDDSLAKLRSRFAQVPEVAFVENGRNLGFARGVNVGVQHALEEGAAAVLLVNNDAVLAPDCLTELENALDRVPGAGVAGPRIFFHADPERVWQGGGYFRRWKAAPATPEKNRLDSELSSDTREVSFLTGCILLIRREVLETAGLFAPEFFFYHEDVDFCLRARKSGFRLLYVPTARAWHKIANVAADRTSPFVLYHLARSQLLCVRKNFSPAYFAYALLVHLLVFTPFRVLQVARGSRSPGALRSWFKGTWAGLVGA